MNIKILDCTLRDGGYINNWEFGETAIKSIVKKLTEAKIDIIECGFFTNKPKSNTANPSDFALFSNVEEISKFIPTKNINIKYVAMIKFGENEVKLDDISNYSEKSIDGIRIIFQEQDIEKAVHYGEVLMKKGYKIFMQPVKVNFYSDVALIGLIKKINDLNPYAFYIVDTFGSMYESDLLRLFHLVDDNLKADVKIGFHSHNNLQLSFSNAQALIGLENSKREIIIDSSVFGMGRGAGNLATELLAKHINDNFENKYEITPLLNIYDKHLSKIFVQKPWGYSLPYFLNAVHNCHPSYATYLVEKKNISAESINEILKKIPDANKRCYDKDLIENICLKTNMTI